MKQRLGRCLAAAALVLCVLNVLPPGARAAGTARVAFESSTPDAAGCFQVTMTMYDATFRAFQFALRYDTSVLQPVDEHGAAAAAFGDFAQPLPRWLSTVGTELNTATGLIDFTGFLMPGATGSVVNADTEAAAGEDGIELFTFRFKRLKEGDGGLQVATKAKGEPYRSACPLGVIVTGRGGDVPVNVTFQTAGRPADQVSESIPVATPAPVASPTPVPSQAPAPSRNPVPSPSSAPAPSAAPDKTPAPSKEPQPSQNSGKTNEAMLRGAVFLKIDSHAAVSEGGVSAIYPGERSVTAFARDGRTFVPVRFVAEKLGADVDWENDTHTVVIRKGPRVIRMAVGSTTYTVDGVEKAMDVPACFTPSSDGNSRTMVPVRFVSEALEYQVEWNQPRQLVVIAPLSLSWDPEGGVEREVMDEAVSMLAVYSMFV